MSSDDAVVVAFPRLDNGDGLPGLTPFLPSARSLLVAFSVVTGVLLALVVARATPLFGVRSIEVTGAGPLVERQVRRTLDARTGASLVGLDLSAAGRDVAALSTVAEVTFDRAYPHTLRVAIVPERPVAVVRQGAESFLVSERGRVISRSERGAKPELARVWIGRELTLVSGETVEGPLRTAIGAVTPLAGARFPSRVVSVTTGDALVMRLRSGLELRMGNMRDVPLKLAVAGRVIPLLPEGSGYLDVSVPHRPVAGSASLESQVEPETSASSGA